MRIVIGRGEALREMLPNVQKRSLKKMKAVVASYIERDSPNSPIRFMNNNS